MHGVRPKKFLGQHFLKDKNIAQKIVDALSVESKDNTIIEIGPGTGVLSELLILRQIKELLLIEIDRESIAYLKENFIHEKVKIIEADFLKMNISDLSSSEISIIGNFPYNISSQIIFKTIDNRHLIPEFAGMFQKEVAERICASPGNKQYGVISVLTQAYYNTEYLFTVNENVFNPPPKVKSGVIRLVRKENFKLDCDEILFKKIVKESFNTRRKMLRVSLKRLIGKNEILQNDFFQKRPEQLSVIDFVNITNLISENR